MLEAAGRRVHLGGNIGSPLIGRLTQIAPGDVVVLELSSFQLDFFGPMLAVSPRRAPGPKGDAEPRGDLVSPLFPEGAWSPPVAAVLNVTPNHLDRHPTMAAYTAAKAHIVRHQRPQDRAVLNADDPVSRGFAALTPGQVACFGLQGPLEQGAYLQGDALRLRQGEREATICAASELRLRGMHNVANVLAACTVVSALDVPVAAMAAVARSFRGVEHRLEPVREWQGVWYYNDSIATSPERAMAALRSFAEPIVLLAGGRDKHLPWEDWTDLVNAKAVQVITFGEAAALIETALGRLGHATPPVHRAQSLADAVRLAQSLANPGQVVLFSPGGTSFDAFRDYEERGRAFKQYVHALVV
jgi:UDP-N-acetylmuramoylalanine--D-glutamate ligase